MIEGGFLLGTPEEYERNVPPEIDALANRLAKKHGEDVADRYILDDEVQFTIRAAIWGAVAEAVYELRKP